MRVCLSSLFKEIEFLKRISKITKNLCVDFNLREINDESGYGQVYEPENSITEILEVNYFTLKQCSVLIKIF